MILSQIYIRFLEYFLYQANCDSIGCVLPILILASFDRADLLKWLVVAKGLDIDATDGRGRTPQQIAEAAKSSSSVSWIIEYKARKLISRFILRNLERIKAIQKHQSIVRNVITIQKLVRGHLTRKLYRGTLFLRLEESQRFNVTWMPYIRLLFNESPYYSGWEAVRSRTCDISHADVDHDTAEKLDDALSRAVLQDTDDESVQEQMDNEPELDSCHGIAKHTISEGTKWSNMFMVTSHVVKFLKSSGDPLYRSFFVRRMQVSYISFFCIVLDMFNSVTYLAVLDKHSNWRMETEAESLGRD